MSRLYKKNSDGKIEDIIVVHKTSSQPDMVKFRYETNPAVPPAHKHDYLLSNFHNMKDNCLTVYGDYTYDDLTNIKPWSQYSDTLKNFEPSGFYNTSKYPSTSTPTDMVNSNDGFWVEPTSYRQYMDETWAVFDDLSKRYRSSYRQDSYIPFYDVEEENSTRSFNGLTRPDNSTVHSINDFPLFRSYIDSLRKNTESGPAETVSFNTNIHTVNTTNGVIQNPTWLHSVGSDNDTRYYNGLHVPYSSSKMKFGFEMIISCDELDDYVWRKDEDKWEYSNNSVKFYGPWNWVGVITKGIGYEDETRGYIESGEGYIKFYDLKKARKIAKNTYYLRDDDYYLFRNGTAAEISNMFIGCMNPYMQVRNYDGPYIGISQTFNKTRSKSYLQYLSFMQGGVLDAEHSTWNTDEKTAAVLSQADAERYMQDLATQTQGGQYTFTLETDINKGDWHSRPMLDVVDFLKIRILNMNWFFRPVND